MKKHIQNALIFSSIFFFVFFSTFCQEKTEEELILEMMDDVGKYAEKKDMSGIMINFADDYHDFEGRGKKETQDMINEYHEKIQRNCHQYVKHTDRRNFLPGGVYSN